MSLLSPLRERFYIPMDLWELKVGGVFYGPYNTKQEACAKYRELKKEIPETASVSVYKNGEFNYVIR